MTTSGDPAAVWLVWGVQHTGALDGLWEEQADPDDSRLLALIQAQDPAWQPPDNHRHEDLDEANDSWMELVRAVSEAELGERAAEHDDSMRGFLRLR